VSFAWQQSLTDGERKEVLVDLVPQPPPPTPPPPPHGTPKWLFFGAAGAAVVALGVATDFAIRAHSLSQDQQNEDPLLRTSYARDTVSSESTVANVFFVSGALFAAGATVLAFTTDWSDGANASSSSARLVLAPWLGANAGGATARGQF
jgi:hypothetical protein